MRLASALLLLLASPLSAAEAPNMEMVLTDKVLTAFLMAVSPIEQTVSPNLGGLGAAGQLRVTLSNPSVRVTNAAVKARMDFRVRDASGMVDLTGVATPDLQIVALPAKGKLEARLSHLVVTLPGGMSLPVEGAIAPIELPGVWTTEVSFGARKLTATATASEVVTESGQVRLRGVAVFTPVTETAKQR